MKKRLFITIISIFLLAALQTYSFGTPILDSIGNKSVNEMDTLIINLHAVGTFPLLFTTADMLPGFCEITDFLDGSAEIECNPDCSDSGTYFITVVVSEGITNDPNLIDSETFELDVNDVNCNPELASIGPQVVYEGDTLGIPLSATDPDSDPLTFTAPGLPDFCTLTDNGDGTGTIDCEPSYADSGSYPDYANANVYPITVRVTDADGLFASESFDLTVNDSPTPSGVVLLFDISGSMNTGYDGSWTPNDEERRLTLAKNAAMPFMILLNDFNSEWANFGIATFPTADATYPWPCEGEEITPMTLITDDTLEDANITIMGLSTNDNTPLLDGVQTAMDMFGGEIYKSIVLLTDGYHNCPSWVSATDTNVIDMINELNDQNIRVFTIGFGRPTDVDHPLLQAFADGTTPLGYVGSQFYDVTTASFDPNIWDPAVDLHSTYKSILVDVLNLYSPTDPMGVIESGNILTVPFHINEYDRKVSVYLSWKTSDQDRLGLIVTDPNDVPVPTDGMTEGVSFHQGDNFKIITMDHSFLREVGEPDPQPWKIRIDATNVPSDDAEPYQYSVIVDSDLKMDTGFDKNEYYVGDVITLSARITAAGQPFTGLSNVTVEITGPEEGIGNWFATNDVSAAELKTAPDERGGEELLPFERKALYLMDIRMVLFPGLTGPYTLTLYDNGTNGDAVSNDGIYANYFSNTFKEGTYSFHFQASGETDAGIHFERDDMVEKYLTINVSNVPVDFFCLSSKGNLRRLEVIMTPQDKFGNYLDPRRAGEILLNSDKGSFKGELHNMLDGSFSQVLELSLYRASDIFRLGLNVQDTLFTHNFKPSDYLPSIAQVSNPVSPGWSYTSQNFIPNSLFYLPLEEDPYIYNNYAAFPFYSRSNLPFVLPYYGSNQGMFPQTYMAFPNQLTYLFRFSRGGFLKPSFGLPPFYWYWYSIFPYHYFCY